jgi:hypothetical protein
MMRRRRGLTLRRVGRIKDPTPLHLLLPSSHPTFDDAAEEAAAFAKFRAEFGPLGLDSMCPRLGQLWTSSSRPRVHTRVVFALEKKLDIPRLTTKVQEFMDKDAQLRSLVFVAQQMSADLALFVREHNKRTMKARAVDRKVVAESRMLMARLKKTVGSTSGSKRTRSGAPTTAAATAATVASATAAATTAKRGTGGGGKKQKTGADGRAAVTVKTVKTHAPLEGPHLPLIELWSVNNGQLSCLFYQHDTFPPSMLATSAQMVKDLATSLNLAELQQLSKVYDTDPSVAMHAAMEGDVIFFANIVPDRGNRVWEPKVVVHDDAHLYHSRPK